MGHELQEINIHLITELKAQGRHWDAQKLVDAYHADVKKNKHQLSVELLRQDRNIKHHFGICKADGCDKKCIEGKVHCARHAWGSNRRYRKGEPKYIINKPLQKRKCILSNGAYRGHQVTYHISVSPDGEIHESIKGLN